MIRFILAVVLGASAFTAAAEDGVSKALPTDEEAAAIRSAEVAGTAIYRHDHAAAVATDSALGDRAFKKDKRVHGWITQDRQGEIVVTFIDQTPAALYRVVVSTDGVAGSLSALESPTPLTAYESGAAASRSAALAATFQPCSNDYNSVVLPSADEAGKDWVVYLLPGTTMSDLVPVGGTYRMDIHDSRVISQRGFTRTCIALQTGPQSVGLMITHLLDPTPTEAHVFWSLWAKKPIYVATASNDAIWIVEGSKIRLMERRTAED